MDISSILRKRVAPELNHLYTVPPFQREAGADCGWFCREHALHTYFVARLLGIESDIRRGDFLVKSPGLPVISSIDDTSDHAWCRVGDMLPVDLSLTLRHFGTPSQLRMPICKVGTNGPYQVWYSKDSTAALKSPLHSVCYVEHEIMPLTHSDLLDDPYRFVFTASDDDPLSWHNLYGAEIYARITLHCFRVATGHAKTTRNRLSASDSPDWIFAEYPDATPSIHALLN